MRATYKAEATESIRISGRGRSMITQSRCSHFKTYILGSLIALIFCPLTEIYAQLLDEITVTAQRREQSLREVPISIEAITGAELVLQGFREMDDLSNFVPSVEIDFTTQEQDISIRGYGTVGANLSSDQAAPTFVDGIHYSRGSMIQAAFVDLERIERIARSAASLFRPECDGWGVQSHYSQADR